MKKFSGGYVGILVIMIAVAIGIFLMAKEFEKMSIKERDILKEENENTDGSRNVSPIDKATDIKSTVESRDRANFGI